MDLVSWSKVCKEFRGLGIRRLEILHWASLNKWLLWFALQRESLWRKIIERKFGKMEGRWISCEVRESFDTSLWNNIRKG